MRPEFPKKSRSKRRRIFKDRLTPLVSDLVRSAPMSEPGASLPLSFKSRQMTKAIVDDIVEYVEQHSEQMLKDNSAPLSEKKLVERIKREVGG